MPTLAAPTPRRRSTLIATTFALVAGSCAAIVLATRGGEQASPRESAAATMVAPAHDNAENHAYTSESFSVFARPAEQGDALPVSLEQGTLLMGELSDGEIAPLVGLSRRVSSLPELYAWPASGALCLGLATGESRCQAVSRSSRVAVLLVAPGKSGALVVGLARDGVELARVEGEAGSLCDAAVSENAFVCELEGDLPASATLVTTAEGSELREDIN